VAGPTASDKVRHEQRLKLLGTPSRTGTPSLTGLTPAQSSPVSSYSDPDEISFYGIGSGLSVDELAMLQQAGESPQNIARLAQMNQARMLQQARQHTFDPTLGQIVRDTATPEGAMGAVNGALFRFPEALYGAVQSPDGKQQMKEWMYQNPGFGYGSTLGDMGTMMIPGGALARGAGVGFNALRLKDLAEGMYGLEAAAKGSHLGKAMLAQTLEQMAPRAAANALEGNDQTPEGAALAAVGAVGVGGRMGKLANGGITVGGRFFPMEEGLYKAAAENPALKQAVERAVPATTLQMQYYNPTAVAHKELLHLSGQGPVQLLPLKDRPIKTLEELKGMRVVPVFADQTRSGVTFDDLNGIKLMTPGREDAPVTSFGGFDWGRLPNLINDGSIHASALAPAQTMQNRFLKTDDAVGLGLTMKPEASDYALHTTQLATGAIPSLPYISKDAKDALNEAIKAPDKSDPAWENGFPDFVGIDSTHLRDQIQGLGTFKGTTGTGALRKKIAKVLRSKQFEAAGFPSMDTVYNTINEPGLELGQMGRTIYLPDTSVKSLKDLGTSRHPSYNTNIPGTYGGGLESGIPWQIIYQDSIKNSGKNPNAFFTSLYKSNTPAYYPVIDDQMISRANSYLNSGVAKPFMLGGIR